MVNTYALIFTIRMLRRLTLMLLFHYFTIRMLKRLTLMLLLYF